MTPEDPGNHYFLEQPFALPLCRLAHQAMFVLQQHKEQKKKQLERGEGLLSRLEEIRDALLQGTISKERLAEIARFVRERQIKGEDEWLNEVLAEIELRVEVELAKLTK